jgi:hypothetical protein
MQGMNMMCAVLLVVMHGVEERCFWLMVAIMRQFGMLEYYREGLVRLHSTMDTFEALLKGHVPDLASHLEAQGVVPHCYITPWFVTLFCYDADVVTAARLLDVFFLLVPGDEWVYRFGLAFLHCRAPALLTHSFEQAVVELKAMRYVDSEELDRMLRAAYALDLASLCTRMGVQVQHRSRPPVSMVCPVTNSIGFHLQVLGTGKAASVENVGNEPSRDKEWVLASVPGAPGVWGYVQGSDAITHVFG